MLRNGREVGRSEKNGRNNVWSQKLPKNPYPRPQYEEDETRCKDVDFHYVLISRDRVLSKVTFGIIQIPKSSASP